GNATRQPTTPEPAHMAALVDTLMQQGALGVWTAPEYAPASYSTTNEIIALARAARRHGGIYASHMRNEGIQIDQALNELFRVARRPTSRPRSRTSRCPAGTAGDKCAG